MKNPNGYGCIKKLSGNRRRPYVFVISESGKQRVMTAIRGTGHTTHDCRHTCATLLDNFGANPNAIRRILGHAGGDVTDRVYTHKAIRQLRKAINLIK